MPQHRAVLDAKSLEGRQHGQATCRDMRSSVMHSLPHRPAPLPQSSETTHLSEAWSLSAQDAQGLGAQVGLLTRLKVALIRLKDRASEACGGIIHQGLIGLGLEC